MGITPAQLRQQIAAPAPDPVEAPDSALEPYGVWLGRTAAHAGTTWVEVFFRLDEETVLRSGVPLDLLRDAVRRLED